VERASPRDVAGLGRLLVACVEDGASVGFLSGLSEAEASDFWSSWLAGPAEVLVVRDGAEVVGTVSLVPAPLPNARHRAEVAKLLVHPAARRRGLARQLLVAAEARAMDLGRTLLVLDTVTGSAAASLYAATGWTEVGTVPAYAALPDGSLAPTTFFCKSL
jgi:GNAT superfamily N-acetyltransferase